MQNIRGFLKRIARKNGITMGALTTELGYRSKTSLERLMNGSTRDARVWNGLRKTCGPPLN